MTVMIVDYGCGNLFSISQALNKIGVVHAISERAEELATATRIIFPGVGAFGDAANGLKERNLVGTLKGAAASGTPMLGICVGCQLLMSQGEEFGLHDGLDLIEGRVQRLPDPVAGDPDKIRIPNVGWRELSVSDGHSDLFNLDSRSMMYFVHSYAPFATDQKHVAASIYINGQWVPAAVRKNNIAGVQFHPEKSGSTGLRILESFVNLGSPA